MASRRTIPFISSLQRALFGGSGRRIQSSVHTAYLKVHSDFSTQGESHSSQIRIKTPLRLMPLGGSVTYGVGSSDGNGYRKVLLDMLLSSNCRVSFVGSRRSGTMSNNDNEGWRGYRLDQIETKARISVATSLPNVFTINAGSNDCIQNHQLQDFGKRMGNMLEYLWQNSPSSTIILSTLLVSADKEVSSRVLFVNDQIRELAKFKAAAQKRIVLADMHSPNGPQVGDLVDGIHPDDVGYEKMANIWLASIHKASLRGFI
ncbi:SGNH hydrolase-type esterase domain-containing protein [Dactylonectria estremocensis]|uniref:SGNH hydrolase-type esterase domain-containing protein n=1 Tax=Dactylonectria estremocensis TaxID=1079267 RepID=A0A9P9DPS7_9HYPO|nr:SGNH hydrolase-type esterase domain-containing protein [Dactylonectria estremocensis]